MEGVVRRVRKQFATRNPRTASIRYSRQAAPPYPRIPGDVPIAGDVEYAGSRFASGRMARARATRRIQVAIPPLVSLLIVIICLFTPILAPIANAQLPAVLPTGIPAEEQTALRSQFTTLEARLDLLRPRAGALSDPLADAALFPKAVLWALRYSPSLAPADVALIRRAMERGRERADALEAGKRPWEQKCGRVVRGYVSDVDGSVQPYGLVIPASYDPAKPIRLDVVLHGSVQPNGMAALHFLMPFDQGDSANPGAASGSGANGPAAPRDAGSDYIELHPMGRVENCSRWAGETDVFEAIEDVCRHYRIDRDRIVLRGMSAGASGNVAPGPEASRLLRRARPLLRLCRYPPLLADARHELRQSGTASRRAGADAPCARLRRLRGERRRGPGSGGDRRPRSLFQAPSSWARRSGAEGLEMVNLISPGTGHVRPDDLRRADAPHCDVRR